MIQGINALLKTKLTAQTNLLIKDFHDSCLDQTLPEATLVVDNLTDGQIWHQMNQHLCKSIGKWNKFLNKVTPMIEEQPLQQEGEEEYGEEEGEEGENQEEEMEGDYGEEMEEEEEGEREGEESEEMLDMEEEDVGLYGELLDDEEEEKYDHEDQEEDPELENFKKLIGSKDMNVEGEEDELEDQNFDHFREIEGENQQQENQKNEQDLDEISKLENRLLSRNDWRWKGQISSKQRPVNSLVQNPMEFMRGLKFQQQGSPTQNSMLEELIKRRILDDMFDDRVRIEIAPGFKEHFTNLPEISVEKSKHSLGELYEIDFANSLGMKNNKEEREKKQILNLFKELNYKLDRLSNFSFIPKPILETKVSSQPYILREENIPITATQNQSIAQKLSQINLKSRKEEGSQHLKTKRIKRQRRKEQEGKRMKRIIEYGGMSKVEAEARKKIEKSKKGKTTKYSQSGQFFKKFQDNIGSKERSKPNPNIGKLKL